MHNPAMVTELDRYLVRPDGAFDLQDIDPAEVCGFSGDKNDAKRAFKKLNLRLEELQESFYAEGKHRLLVVFQAMDCGGKDGTIRAVFEHVNPQGVRVASFGRPTDHELAHDYLWRVHPHVPSNGRWTLFNRSHYEDVLVVRVRELVDESRWRRRYRHIRDFEQMLVDEGTTVVKFFLHISKEEQRERLQERIDLPRKRWKFDSGDLAERKRWDDYQLAYQEMLTETSTTDAPWYVIPANRNWYRNWLIATLLVETLEGLDIQMPEPEDDIEGLVVE